MKLWQMKGLLTITILFFLLMSGCLTLESEAKAQSSLSISFPSLETDSDETLWGNQVSVSVTDYRVIETAWGKITSFRKNDTTPPSEMTDIRFDATCHMIEWTLVAPPDVDYDHSLIWKDGIRQSDVSWGTKKVTWHNLTAGKPYTIATKTVDTTGNINTTFVNITAETDGECIEWPKIMFTFDDGCSSDYTAAYPILDTYDYDATSYIVQDYIGKANYLSEIQVSRLYEDKWDIANHGKNHTRLTRVDADIQKSIIQEGQIALFDKGFTRSAYYLAYPFGDYNNEVITSAEEVGTLTARNTLVGTIFTPKTSGLLEMNISSYIHGSTSVSSVESTISRGDKNQTIIILLHRIDNVPGPYNWSPSKLARLTNWMYDHGYQTITISEWYSLNMGSSDAIL